MPANTYERRARSALGELDGTRDPFWHLACLVFLHALSGPDSRATPPPGLGWEQLRADAHGDRAQAAIELTERQHPELLGGLAARVEFAHMPARSLTAALARVDALVSEPAPGTHPLDRFGALHMTVSGLSAQQWRGEFYTPQTVADTLSMMLGAPQPGDWVLDPACGTGGLLLAALARARRELGEPLASAVTLIGVELSERTSALANMNLVLAGAGHQAHVFCGNALSQPLLAPDATRTLRHIQFHQVIANPPFGTRINLTRAPTAPLVIPGRLLGRRIAVRARRANDVA